MRNPRRLSPETFLWFARLETVSGRSGVPRGAEWTSGLVFAEPFLLTLPTVPTPFSSAPDAACISFWRQFVVRGATERQGNSHRLEDRRPLTWRLTFSEIPGDNTRLIALPRGFVGRTKVLVEIRHYSTGVKDIIRIQRSQIRPNRTKTVHWKSAHGHR